jgi:hypothetical protein
MYMLIIFMAMYSFVPHFREAKFCDVPSIVFDKLWCAADEESLRNTALDHYHHLKKAKIKG